MKIIAKCGLDGLAEAFHKDFTTLELYTNRKTIMNRELWDDVLSYCAIGKLDIVSVHTPESTIQKCSHDGTDYIDTATIMGHDYDNFILTCERANALAMVLRHKISVVLHASWYWTEKDFKNITTELEKSFSIISDVLNTYRNVKIVIENLSLWYNMNLNTEDRIGHLYEPILYAETYGKVYDNADHCVSVLWDTCHTLKTQKVVESFYKDKLQNLSIYYKDLYSIRNTVNIYKPYLTQVHLANIIDGDKVKGQHGTAFIYERDEDRSRVIAIMKVLQEINFDGFVIMEISEDSYPSMTNSMVTWNTLQKLNLI